MEEDEQLYRPSEAAKAGRFQADTVQKWIKRGLPVLSDKIQRSEQRGSASLFSFEGILQIAVASELVRWGVGPRDALLAGAQFSSTSDGGQRPVGRPYDGPRWIRTWGVYRRRQGIKIERVDFRDARTALTSIFEGEAGVVILDLNELYEHAARELGRDPNDYRKAMP